MASIQHAVQGLDRIGRHLISVALIHRPRTGSLPRTRRTELNRNVDRCLSSTWRSSDWLSDGCVGSGSSVGVGWRLIRKWNCCSQWRGAVSEGQPKMAVARDLNRKGNRLIREGGIRSRSERIDPPCRECSRNSQTEYG